MSLVDLKSGHFCFLEKHHSSPRERRLTLAQRFSAGGASQSVSRHVVTIERPADGSNFNRRYATRTIRALFPGVETAGLKSAAAHAAKSIVFSQKCPDISWLIVYYAVQS